MTKVLNVTAIAGSLQQPSRTEALLDAIIGELQAAIPARVRTVKLSEIGPQVGGAMQRVHLPADAFAAVQAIEEADLLIVASPVYRASYTGLLKHLFDFVGREALVGRPVLLAATGGTERHMLMIDHQLRPLFAFFDAVPLPLGIYATEGDFIDFRPVSPALVERIARAVDAALPWLNRLEAAQPAILRQPFLAQL